MRAPNLSYTIALLASMSIWAGDRLQAQSSPNQRYYGFVVLGSESISAKEGGDGTNGSFSTEHVLGIRLGVDLNQSHRVEFGLLENRFKQPDNVLFESDTIRYHHLLFRNKIVQRDSWSAAVNLGLVENGYFSAAKSDVLVIDPVPQSMIGARLIWNSFVNMGLELAYLTSAHASTFRVRPGRIVTVDVGSPLSWLGPSTYFQAALNHVQLDSSISQQTNSQLRLALGQVF